jgi:hypothetical protein
MAGRGQQLNSFAFYKQPIHTKLFRNWIGSEFDTTTIKKRPFTPVVDFTEPYRLLTFSGQFNWNCDESAELQALRRPDYRSTQFRTSRRRNVRPAFWCPIKEGNITDWLDLIQYLPYPKQAWELLNASAIGRRNNDRRGYGIHLILQSWVSVNVGYSTAEGVAEGDGVIIFPRQCQSFREISL